MHYISEPVACKSTIEMGNKRTSCCALRYTHHAILELLCNDFADSQFFHTVYRLVRRLFECVMLLSATPQQSSTTPTVGETVASDSVETGCTYIIAWHGTRAEGFFFRVTSTLRLTVLALCTFIGFERVLKFIWQKISDSVQKRNDRICALSNKRSHQLLLQTLGNSQTLKLYLTRPLVQVFH
ncbi:hypothetical protein Tcan_03690 [Toxocara canis]|uniref:Uncharacterized protein n=1 Tax=Toxocara canis TaxID=6265 RepID=A0A0B2VU90_TOXCA|nr:hypothetical protein Tcan_03690 [Toxocara canis]